MDEAIEALAEQIRAAASTRTPLRIRAGGSKDFYGNPPHGAMLDPRAACGVVAYEPTELALAARCGTTLAEIETLLETHGQMLAFEPPRFAAGATIGGCIACGLAGPRRASAGYAYGGVRDFVLGARLLDGRSQLLSFGGMVMKNVAGYDAARLLVGSLGALGVIVEVSLKVVPRHPVETTLQFSMGESAALNQLNTWGGLPLPISASAWQGDALWIRLAGSAAAVTSACANRPIRSLPAIRRYGGCRCPRPQPRWDWVRGSSSNGVARNAGFEPIFRRRKSARAQRNRAVMRRCFAAATGQQACSRR